MSDRREPSVAAGFFRAASQAWLILGVTLLLFFLLEFGYRGARAVRHALSRPGAAIDSSQHPYARAPWWAEMQRDLARRKNRFDPYRGHWALPLATRYVNIDSLGRRVTPQPSIPGPHRQLFFLGGSTAWGYTARDSGTIEAFLAEALRARGISDVEVVNLAQAAFNSSQEATTLVVELARGRIPALVVALDGYNDIATAGKYGEPGHTYGDWGIQEQIERGTRNFGQELTGLGRHSALVQSLRDRLGLRKPTPPAAQPVVCGAVAQYYRNQLLSSEALGRGFGFPVLYVLQPHSAVSKKRLTRWEAGLQVPRLVPLCMASIDSALADRRGTSFLSLASLFDADTETVFLDEAAHITEAANRRVAERIADVVTRLLEAGSAR
jgi:lysophospholipase L1-like esterase